MSPGNRRRRLAAVLAADVAGYTQLIENDTDATVAAWQQARRKHFNPLIDDHDGRIVKLTGDGFMVEFSAIQDAVACAAAIQESNRSGPLDLRIGVHLGDIVDDGEDIHGEGVNIAARLEALADPGGICVSAAVHELVRNRLPLAFEDMGDHQVKHVSAPVRVFQLRPGFTDAQSVPLGKAAPVLPDDKPSIAVLPFVNMSSDREQEYFADGITEDIITDLSRLPGTLVIARNSTFRYKGQAVDIPTVCRELGVRYIVEGSVRKGGSRVRVTAQLIDGLSGGHEWAERYDRKLDDIFSVQDDVTQQIVEALKVSLAGNRPAAGIATESTNAQAYDRVLQAREQYRRFSLEANERAAQLYRQAIEFDPDYAVAYAGLAMTSLHRWLAGDEAELERAYDYVRKAKNLGPELPAVCEAAASVLLFHRDFEAAIAANERWLAIEPNSAEAHAHMAGILMHVGRASEVEERIEKAMRLNPYYPFYYPLYRGQSCLSLGQFTEAIAYCLRSIELNRDTYHPYIWLAAAYAHSGDVARAKQAVTQLLERNPAFSLNWVEKFAPYKLESDRVRLLEGLAMAGLETGSPARR